MSELGFEEEQALYQPREEVLQSLEMVSLWAFVGPFGSGKDSIMSWLEQHRPHQFAKVIGDTSRPPREGEVDGITYHFRQKSDMLKDLQAGRFVQVAPGFVGDFYATRPEQYPTDKIAMKTVQARVIPTFQSLGFKEVRPLLIVPHSDDAWRSWQSDRRHNSKDQQEREAEAIQSYTLSLTDSTTRYILNDEIEKAGQRIVRLADGQNPPDEVKAKQIAVHNLEALKERLGKILNKSSNL